MGEVVERVTRKNEKLSVFLPLTISAQNGLVAQTEFFDKQVVGKNLANYYLIEKGEFAYNKSYSNGYPLGAIKRLDKYENGLLSILYILFKPTKVNSQFLVAYYDSNHWHKAVSDIAVEGARNHGLLNIPTNEFFETQISVPPTKAEQQAIGEFFRQLDDTIAFHQRTQKKYQNLKKSYLEKMFAQINYAWKQRKLGDMAMFSKGRGYSKSDITNFGFPIILYGQLYTNYQTTISKIDTFVSNESNAIKSSGNEVLVPASGETAKEIVRASFIKKQGVIIGGDLNIIKPNEFILPEFLALSISNGNPKLELIKRAQGKSVVHLRNEDLKEVSLYIPTLSEQQAIGEFFRQLDDTIAFHQRELEKYQQLKQVLLDQLFV